ncbi:hypothetical protein [Altererythrobacter sp. ZODW24]|uniref:hypothetical protein n=1 Tax=Altererythrobacter sp. ZODW24 TaxID=2185142 RepID=UPI000DF81D00|nr:hypothetical protein [Altererythrobacter sp. ZODW24]
MTTARGMTSVGPEQLPDLQRLALTYAPSAARRQTLALLSLDGRLAGIVRGAREPILAQMRLAWWRDRFSEDRAAWPEGEPLLAILREWSGSLGGLSAMADGWEVLLTEGDLTAATISEFAAGRGEGWAVLASELGADQAEARKAGRAWALVDLASHLTSEPDQAAAAELIAGHSFDHPALPRSLRTLAVLHALAARSVRRGAGMLDGAGAVATAMRVGIVGR